MAGLLDRGDWDGVRALQEVAINSVGDKTDAVIALPFSAYDSDWKFLKGLERYYTPISVYLGAQSAG